MTTREEQELLLTYYLLGIEAYKGSGDYEVLKDSYLGNGICYLKYHLGLYTGEEEGYTPKWAEPYCDPLWWGEKPSPYYSTAMNLECLQLRADILTKILEEGKV